MVAVESVPLTVIAVHFSSGFGEEVVDSVRLTNMAPGILLTDTPTTISLELRPRGDVWMGGTSTEGGWSFL